MLQSGQTALNCCRTRGRRWRRAACTPASPPRMSSCSVVPPPDGCRSMPLTDDVLPSGSCPVQRPGRPGALWRHRGHGRGAGFPGQLVADDSQGGQCARGHGAAAAARPRLAAAGGAGRGGGERRANGRAQRGAAGGLRTSQRAGTTVQLWSQAGITASPFVPCGESKRFTCCGSSRGPCAR